MAFTTSQKIYDIHIISNPEKEKIKIFLKGSYYDWCKNRHGEWFNLQKMMGGVNVDWEGTPLIVLYDYYRSTGKSVKYSMSKAAIAAGWLLKKSLNDDKRKFDTRIARTREYLWVK